MKITKINKYTTSGCEFLGCSCYSENGNNFLLNVKNRTSIIVSDLLLKQILDKKLSDSLKLKLLKRGFLNVKGIDLASHSDIPPEGGFPSYFMVEFTKQCNLHCKYCFKDFKLAENQRKISIAQLSKICDYIIKYCKENEIKTISFQP